MMEFIKGLLLVFIYPLIIINKMINISLYPVLFFISFIAWIISFWVKALLTLGKSIKHIKVWTTINIIWKLNNIHRKLKERNK